MWPDPRPEMNREEDFSTVEARAQASARLSGQDGDRRGPQGDRGAPGARAQAPLGLSPEAAVPAGRKPALGRLCKRPEFLAAAKGRRFHTDRITLQARYRADGESDGQGLRVGFTVTKREGHATERNRIRRRLRAAMAEAGASFGREPSDIVVIGRRQALAVPFSQLVEDLGRALQVVTRPRPVDGAPPRRSPRSRESHAERR